MKKIQIPTLGYACGIAANDFDCHLGPFVLKKSDALQELPVTLKWQAILETISAAHGLAAIHPIAEIAERLATKTKELVQKQQKFIVLGGDHTSAIGTWSGAASALQHQHQGELGLIWVDAHMDSHTPKTTQTGNVHGMPLAALLGHGAPELTHVLDTNIKLLPKNICLIGVRSYEAGEAELLKQLYVKCFFMDEIQQKGIQNVFKEALALVTAHTAGYGISIDLDAIDPQDAPGVGVPVNGGIRGEDFCRELKIFNPDSRLLGIEIVEFNPNRDQHKKTENLIKDIISAFFNPNNL